MVLRTHTSSFLHGAVAFVFHSFNQMIIVQFWASWQNCSHYKRGKRKKNTTVNVQYLHNTHDAQRIHILFTKIANIWNVKTEWKQINGRTWIAIQRSNRSRSLFRRAMRRQKFFEMTITHVHHKKCGLFNVYIC